MKQMLNTIELFAGTKSFSNVAKELSYMTLTFDNDKELKPDVCIDILETDEWGKGNKFFDIDVLWASPPCTAFSISSVSTHFSGGIGRYTPKSKTAKLGIALLEKTIQIISITKPKVWFIENPRGLMRKIIMNLFLKYKIRPYKQVTVTYCQYGDKRMKPTDIWTNLIQWYPKKMCFSGANCHEAAPRGSKTGTQGLKDAKERGKIPRALFIEIFKSIEKTL